MKRKYTWAVTIFLAIALVGLGYFLHGLVLGSFLVSTIFGVAAILCMITALIFSCKLHFIQGKIEASEDLMRQV